MRMTRIKGLRQDSPIDGGNSKIVSCVGEKSIEGARRFRCFDPFTWKLKIRCEKNSFSLFVFSRSSFVWSKGSRGFYGFVRLRELQSAESNKSVSVFLCFRVQIDQDHLASKDQENSLVWIRSHENSWSAEIKIVFSSSNWPRSLWASKSSRIETCCRFAYLWGICPVLR